MPRKILSMKMRVIDPYDDVMVEKLMQRPPFHEYFYQRPHANLPLLIEHDYVDQHYLEWSKAELEKVGYPDSETNLRYVVLDYEFEPINRSTPNLSFPFMINSMFDYKGYTFNGPFVAGHQAGMSMVQSSNQQKYARYFLPKKFAEIFNSDLQTSIISTSIQRIICSSESDGLVAALPDRGRDSNNYTSSSIARLLMGGNMDDVHYDDRNPLLYDNTKNPIQGIAFKLTQQTFLEAGKEVPEFYNDFTYYSFLEKSLHEKLLNDGRFLRLIDSLRRMGPRYKSTFPDRTEGVLFDPDRNLELMTHLFEFSTGLEPTCAQPV